MLSNRLVALFPAAFAVLMTAPLAGCTSDDAPSESSDLTAGQVVVGGARPTVVVEPADFDRTKPAPLLVLLHGFGIDGQFQSTYWDIERAASERGFLLVHPDGTPDAVKARFWNATDACCNFAKKKVDDSKYLKGLVEEIKSKYNVDPKRVYFAGHSNGGFMSHRMACEHAGDIAAIVSLAGVTWFDASACAPESPVSMLQIHSKDDELIRYDGGKLPAVVGTRYPSAPTTVSRWVAHDGCSATPVSGGEKDIFKEAPGEETTVERYEGCKAGTSVELWTAVGVSHMPDRKTEPKTMSENFAPEILDWLLAHPKQ